MTRVLVTGGQGFLGSHLLHALDAQGHRVRALGRRPADDRGSTANVEWVWGDVRDAPDVERAVEGVEIVIHTVSNFRRGGSDREEARAINVGGTENVCRAAARHGVRQLIHCSTIGVHGDVRQVPANEQTPFHPGDLYQQTKLEAERAVQGLAAQTGLATTILRPISMFGPGDTRMLKLFRLIKRRRFVMIGSGEALFQPAYIDDVVQGFLLCMDNRNAVGQVFIVGGEEYLPLRRLIEVIAEELHVAPPRLRMPLAPVKALAHVCEAICVPLGIEPPLHLRRVSFFQNNRAFCVDKAKRVLGYEPRVELREGVRRTIRWYEERNWL